MSSRGTDDLDDVLRRVCEPDGIRDITAAPFLIDVDGSPWRVATDGARMLLLSGHGGVALEHPAGGQGDDELRRVIACAPAPAWRTTREALCAWAGTDDGICPECHGKGRDKVRCTECRGAGELECDLGHLHDCEECDGSGYAGSACPRCKDRLGRATLAGVLRPSGVAINRALIAGVVQCLPGETVHVGADAERGMVCLYGPGWRLIVMGLRLGCAPHEAITLERLGDAGDEVVA